MTKKYLSTSDEFIASLTPRQKKAFDDEYKDLLVSEMLIAMMKKDNVSVRALAEKAGISPTIIQGIRSGGRKNVSMQSFFRILQGLGYDVIAERGGRRIELDFENRSEESTRRR